MSVTNLLFIQQEMIRYGMFVYLVLGLIGNIFNCIVFTHPTQRRTASSIYFLFLSIFAIMLLIWAIVPPVYTLDHPDLQTQSIPFCKMRAYIAHILCQFNHYITVGICADRFFATKADVHIRSLSSVRVAARLIIIICVFWTLAAIHMPILTDIRGGICGMIGDYKFIYAIYQFTLSASLPIILMSIFSFLTIRNLNQRQPAQIRARRKDRYLLRMVMAEVIINIITSIPFSINQFYGAVTFYSTNKSMRKTEIETFITFITQFLLYLINVTPFYLYILTSKPLRKQFVNIIASYWKKYLKCRFRIAPLNMRDNTAMNNDRIRKV